MAYFYDTLEPSFTSEEPLVASGGDIDSLCHTYFNNSDLYPQETDYYSEKTMATGVDETYHPYYEDSGIALPHDASEWQVKEETLIDLQPYIPDDEVWEGSHETSAALLDRVTEWDAALDTFSDLTLSDSDLLEAPENKYSVPEPQAHLQPPQVQEEGALGHIATKRKRVRGPKNWEFLIRLLVDERWNPSHIRWEDESTATFRLIQPAAIAQMWSSRTRDAPPLSYNNFARGLRYHYSRGALLPVSEKQLVYRCGPLALQFLIDLKKAKTS